MLSLGCPEAHGLEGWRRGETPAEQARQSGRMCREEGTLSVKNFLPFWAPAPEFSVATSAYCFPSVAERLLPPGPSRLLPPQGLWRLLRLPWPSVQPRPLEALLGRCWAQLGIISPMATVWSTSGDLPSSECQAHVTLCDLCIPEHTPH